MKNISNQIQFSTLAIINMIAYTDNKSTTCLILTIIFLTLALFFFFQVKSED